MAKVTVPVVLTIGLLSSHSTMTFDIDTDVIKQVGSDVDVSVRVAPEHAKLASYLQSVSQAHGPTFLRLLADALDEEATVAERGD